MAFVEPDGLFIWQQLWKTFLAICSSSLSHQPDWWCFYLTTNMWHTPYHFLLLCDKALKIDGVFSWKTFLTIFSFYVLQHSRLMAVLPDNSHGRHFWPSSRPRWADTPDWGRLCSQTSAPPSSPHPSSLRRTRQPKIKSQSINKYIFNQLINLGWVCFITIYRKWVPMAFIVRDVRKEWGCEIPTVNHVHCTSPDRPSPR